MYLLSRRLGGYKYGKKHSALTDNTIQKGTRPTQIHEVTDHPEQHKFSVLYSVYSTEDCYAQLSWSINPETLPTLFLGITAGSYVLSGIDHSFAPVAHGLGIITVLAYYKRHLF